MTETAAQPVTSIQSLDDIAVKYSILHEQVSKLEAELAEIKKRKAEAGEALINSLVNNGKDNWRIPGVGQFILKSKNHLSVTDQDKALPFITLNAPELLKVHTTFIKAWFNDYKEKYEAQFGLTTTEFWEENFGIKPYQTPEVAFRKQEVRNVL